MYSRREQLLPRGSICNHLLKQASMWSGGDVLKTGQTMVLGPWRKTTLYSLINFSTSQSKKKSNPSKKCSIYLCCFHHLGHVKVLRINIFWLVQWTFSGRKRLNSTIKQFNAIKIIIKTFLKQPKILPHKH